MGMDFLYFSISQQFEITHLEVFQREIGFTGLPQHL